MKITILVLVFLAATFALLQPTLPRNGVEQEREATRTAIMQDSPRVDYSQVCGGVLGQDLKELAERKGHCKKGGK